MRKKILSALIALGMIFAIMPITAFAADQTELDLSQGMVMITNDGALVFSTPTQSFAKNEDGYKIIQTDSETPTSNRIIITAASSIITIEDINVVVSDDNAAITLVPNSSLDLTISGENSITGGVHCAGLWVPMNSSATIQSTDGSATDSLTAKGGMYAAGIGGNDSTHSGIQGATSGTINIKSGTITAQGGNCEEDENLGGAGIGGGNGGNSGTIIITAENNATAKVTATGGYRGAGIGGGSGATANGNGGNTTISAKTGGSTTVIAQGGGYAAGIGGGYNGGSGNITISSEKDSSTKVEATGGEVSAAIGSGAYCGGYGEVDGDNGKINILAEEGGSTTVKATSGNDGAAIGTSGYNHYYRVDINITAKAGGYTEITATSDTDGAAIGAGYESLGGDVTISSEKNGTTVVTAGGHQIGAGIGAGHYGVCGDITITAEEDGLTKVIATGGENGGSGIGGGEEASCGAIKITGSTVIATGYYDAGIGDNADSIDISDSTITATGGVAMAMQPTLNYTDGYKWRTAAADDFTFSDTQTYTNSTDISYAEIAPGIAITAIELDESELALNIGDTATLTATIAPENATNKTITWTSSDTSVATVDENGQVTAIGAGEATITATTANGKTATCAVTVAEIEVASVTLDESELALNIGDTATLTATIAPENATNKTITWTSSDTSVATVDEDGKITAIGEGTATITATTTNGKTATCEVTVIVPVTGIDIAPTLDLKVGDMDTLVVSFTPENATIKTTTWTSSDTSVATVDEDGMVTAIGAGEATITATTINGKTATCAVTVTEVEVASVTLDKTTLDLTVGDTDTLTATIAPENASDKTVTWTSSDESVATVDENGKVTAIGEGEATITATTANGISATCEVSVEAAVEPTPEPEEPEETNPFIAFIRRIISFFENIFRALGLIK